MPTSDGKILCLKLNHEITKTKWHPRINLLSSLLPGLYFVMKITLQYINHLNIYAAFLSKSKISYLQWHLKTFRKRTLKGTITFRQSNMVTLRIFQLPCHNIVSLAARLQVKKF